MGAVEDVAVAGSYQVGETAWLSRGLEELLYDLRRQRDGEKVDPPVPDPYDVIIVGSGYGGSIAAAELAGSTKDGKKVSICLLERGKEYLPGMFPSRLSDLPAHMRFSSPVSSAPRGRREGLFDIRVGPDVNAVLGNGLGGGSLINAGVMARPKPEVFDGWPAGIRDALFQPDGYLDKAFGLVGAQQQDFSKSTPLKFTALERLTKNSRHTVERATITTAGKVTSGEVIHSACTQCGDCATGCNLDAKMSLDATLLVKAWRNGAHIFTGATVLRLERNAADDGWIVHVAHTDDQLRKRQKASAKLQAKRVILAAGTYGSTEILLRSQNEKLKFSRYLGRSFSANGDAIAVMYGRDIEANSVGDEEVPRRERRIGPTISGMLDLRKGRKGLVIEEIAIPAALRRVFEEVVATTNCLHELGEGDDQPHGPGKPDHDPCAVDRNAMHRTSAFVLMANDGAKGALELIGRDGDEEGDGAVCVRWPALRDHRLFRHQLRTLELLRRRSGSSGRVLPNPMWQLMPTDMQFLFGNQHGPLLTVHPLGGCRIGKDVNDGVVNSFGQVFRRARNPRDKECWDDLVVLDGSIVRNALGINPALTISGLALRAVRALRDDKDKWAFSYDDRTKPNPIRRPRFRRPPETRQLQPTQVRLVERMSGDITLPVRSGGRAPFRIELTLRFAPKAIGELISCKKTGGAAYSYEPVKMARTLDVEEGTLRVFRKGEWLRWRRAGVPLEELDKAVEYEVRLEGSLTLLDRVATQPKDRRDAAWWAWFWNRGFRDSWQVAQEELSRGGASSWPRLRRLICGRWRSSRALAQRAGEVRLLSYALQLKPEAAVRDSGLLDTRRWGGERAIVGEKRLTYARKANPWRQLLNMQLRSFPGDWSDAKPLELDTKYLAEKGVPLFQIESQNDQVSALADVASFAAYFLRLLINIHVWSFRKPETPIAREPQRLPTGIARGPRWLGMEPRLPEPVIREIQLDRLPNGLPVCVRLTRYRPRHVEAKYPVVMIHGYSASGTTFAHHAIRPCMAEYFYSRGHDVWVLDLRTSSGMPTARHNWAFEDAALADLPVAFEEICEETRSDQLDVFAHCMGSAMFTMAVLGEPKAGDPYFEQRAIFPKRVHRAVLSQIAPAVVMSPANIFRGYAMSYLRHFLPFANYDFRVKPDAGLADQLIDRLLATLPYPEEEFSAENPIWPWRNGAFVGTRHRMDALYGRDFSLTDERGRRVLSERVLDYIDDLFGPLNIDTVAQAIHFARWEVVTNQAGRNEFVLPGNIMRRWNFATASIHGTENGLSDIATLQRFQAKFRDEAGVNIETREFRGLGHQDGLIGRNNEQVFRYVREFLTRAEARVS